jgi:hypothetical protein
LSVPIPTFSAALYVADQSTAFSNAATTKLTANTKYQVTTPGNRRIDPAVNVVVEVDADGAGGGGYAVAAPSTYTFDYLFGIVTFNSDQGSAALVRVSGAAMNVVPAGLIKDIALSFSNEIVEQTVLADGGYKKRTATLTDFSADASGYTPPTEDLDTGGATLRLDSKLAAGGRLFLEVAMNGGPTFRAWVKIESADAKNQAGALLESSFKLVGSAILANDGATYVAWGFDS